MAAIFWAAFFCFDCILMPLSNLILTGSERFPQGLPNLPKPKSKCFSSKLAAKGMLPGEIVGLPSIPWDS
jgi:hypothetical protein